MTVRDLLKKIIEESPNLDATVYISKQLDPIEVKSYIIEDISDEGSNCSVTIMINDY